jgi:hypothetical protein
VSVRASFVSLDDSFQSLSASFPSFHDSFASVDGSFYSLNDSFASVDDSFCPVGDSFHPVDASFQSVNDSFVLTKGSPPFPGAFSIFHEASLRLSLSKGSRHQRLSLLYAILKS